jgi:hypothetical protein
MRKGNVMQLRFNQRKQLVDALEARRSFAEKHDAAKARKHRSDEDEVLKKFRERCRSLGRLNLVRLKDEVEQMEYREMQCSLPNCPMSAVTMLDEALAVLKITKQESFTLNGDYKDVIAHAHWLLTATDEPRKATVCA